VVLIIKSEKELKEFDHEEMKEEEHQIELKEGYEQDEEYEESEDQIPKYSFYIKIKKSI
jgi:hypothetical protein